jgi:hypothetical protein
MAAIANQDGRHMVQHVLLPVNIHFHWNLFIFEFLTIYFDFILAAILFKMVAVAMVTKVQNMLSSLCTAEPFENWHKNRSLLKVVLNSNNKKWYDLKDH